MPRAFRRGHPREHDPVLHGAPGHSGRSCRRPLHLDRSSAVSTTSPEDGLSQLGDVVTAIGNYDYSENTVNGEQVEIIAASIRSANHVTQSALMGADIATVPFGI